MYIIPANSKSGQLIFNLFRPGDLILLVTGVFITFVLLITVPGEGTGEMFIKLFPGLLSCVLVFPVAHYHNVMMLIYDIYKFYTSQNRYYWRGWCAWYGFEESDKKEN